VVAEQGMNPAAGTRGLALEAAKQIQRTSRIVTAVHHIAGLHEHRPAPAPASTAVHETGGTQDCHKSIVRTVHVTNRDDAFLRGDGARIRKRLRVARGRSEARHDKCCG
jgi:hypothetical protein